MFYLRSLLIFGIQKWMFHRNQVVLRCLHLENHLNEHGVPNFEKKVLNYPNRPMVQLQDKI